jgi:hypothetical protein
VHQRRRGPWQWLWWLVVIAQEQKVAGIESAALGSYKADYKGGSV